MQQLRDTLDTLKLSAWEQEDLPFDPSGTSGLGDVNGEGDADGVVSSECTTTSRNGTRETDMTSLTSDFSNLSTGDDCVRSSDDLKDQARRAQIRYVVDANGSLCLTGATLDDKVDYLAEMFPTVDNFTIRHTLQKCDEDIDRSMDVLLNLAFFDEQQPDDDGVKIFIPKGVDGFEAGLNGDVGPKNKRKAKGRNGKNNKLQPSCFPSENIPRENKWDASKKDIDFVYSLTSSTLKRERIASAYHANGASLPLAIRSLAATNAPKEERQVDDDPVMVAQVAELSQEFPSVPPLTLAGLLNITRNSISAANELATAMMKRAPPASLTDIIKFTTTPVALDVDVETSERIANGSRAMRDSGRVQNTAGSHFAAGADAFSKATTAYRRGRSDRLMGGAAAYYSAVGREHLERAKREVAAAADVLADSQSTPTMLDLHGVSVQDAVRIASYKVAEWWESLGEGKYLRGGNNTARQGYRIVTGVGRHSHDGTSRLGPAVGKMLAREGWRVEVDEGVLTVVGVRRR